MVKGSLRRALSNPENWVAGYKAAKAAHKAYKEFKNIKNEHGKVKMPKEPGQSILSASRKKGSRKLLPLSGKTHAEKTLSKFVQNVMKHEKEIGSYSVMKTQLITSNERVSSSSNLQKLYSLDGGENTGNILVLDEVASLVSGVLTSETIPNAQLVVQYKYHNTTILKNNNLFKVKLMIWDAYAKTATSNTPDGVMSGGLDANEATSSVTVNQLGIRPSDC